MRFVHFLYVTLMVLVLQAWAQDDNEDDNNNDNGNNDEENQDNQDNEASASAESDSASASESESASESSDYPTASLPDGFDSMDNGDAPAPPATKGASGYGPDDDYIAGAAMALSPALYAGCATAMAVGSGLLWAP